MRKKTRRRNSPKSRQAPRCAVVVADRTLQRDYTESRAELDAFIKQNLELKHTAFTAGNLGALKDALILCAKYSHPLPIWLGYALIDLVNARLGFVQPPLSPVDLSLKAKNILLNGAKEAARRNSAGQKNKKGKHARWIAQYTADMVDRERAEAVYILKYKYGIRDKHKFDAAALVLEGTSAAGKRDAIEQSVKRFKKRLKLDPMRYHVLNTVFLPDQPLNLGPKVLQNLRDWKKRVTKPINSFL